MAFPASYNISYYKGDVYEFILYPKNSDGTEFDLSGYEVEFAIARQRGATPTESYLAHSEIIESNNTVTCVVYPSVGNLLTAGVTYYYDVKITKTAIVGSLVENINYTIVTGTISITDDVVYG